MIEVTAWTTTCFPFGSVGVPRHYTLQLNIMLPTYLTTATFILSRMEFSALGVTGLCALSAAVVETRQGKDGVRDHTLVEWNVKDHSTKQEIVTNTSVQVGV